jgi:hypothetical protein
MWIIRWLIIKLVENIKEDYTAWDIEGGLYDEKETQTEAEEENQPKEKAEKVARRTSLADSEGTYKAPWQRH